MKEQQGFRYFLYSGMAETSIKKGGSKWVQGPDGLGTLIKFINTLEYVYKLKRGYKLPKKSLNNHQYGQKFDCAQIQPKFSKIGILFIGSPGIYK